MDVPRTTVPFSYMNNSKLFRKLASNVRQIIFLFKEQSPMRKFWLSQTKPEVRDVGKDEVIVIDVGDNQNWHPG